MFNDHKIFFNNMILAEIIPGTPKHGAHKAFICTYFERKLRLKPRPILFWLLHENCRFYPVYGYLITIMRLRTSKIGIHVAFIYSHVVNKIQFFFFNRTGISVISKSINSILIFQNKWPKKIKILRAQIPKYFRHVNSVNFLFSNLALGLLFLFKLSKLLFSCVIYRKVVQQFLESSQSRNSYSNFQ